MTRIIKTQISKAALLRPTFKEKRFRALHIRFKSPQKYQIWRGACGFVIGKPARLGRGVKSGHHKSLSSKIGFCCDRASPVWSSQSF